MHLIPRMFSPHPLQNPHPHLPPIILPIHHLLHLSQRGLLFLRADAKPPRGIPNPQLRALRILLRVALPGENGVIVVEEGLVVG